MVDGSSSFPRSVQPRNATFSPSMWVDIFSWFSPNDQVQEMYAEGIETLKKEVKSMLMAASSGKLILLVDTIERLGLAYHFETEIEEKLQKIYNSQEDDGDYDLFTTALRFRLLRQHQYHVSCSIFDIFTDKDNKFDENLSSDIEGLLSLHEASYVQIHGEEILEEALVFTTHHLARMVSQLESPLKHKVTRALKKSLHRDVPIIQMHNYISIYERESSKDELLLKLAKLNFNFLQNLYKKEICELSRWWNNFDLKSKLAYARDRLIECYLLGAAISFEPEYSGVRIWVAKSLQMGTIMDDTYDNYATVEEAELFTQMLERWDIDEIDRLPNYMQIVYRFIMSVYEDYEREAAKQEKSFAVPFFKETVKQLGRAYNQELKWVVGRKMPSFEDFITNSVITSCIYIIFTAIVPGMKSFTKETIDWLLSEPKIIISTAKIGRHLEDLGSHERESMGGKMLTVVDCYMKQHGVSKQETLSMFAKLADDGWKDVNMELATTTSVPKKMVEQILNCARMGEFIYNNCEDGFTNPEKSLAPQIIALFVDPLLI